MNEEYEIVEVKKHHPKQQPVNSPMKRASADTEGGHRKERTESGMEIKDTRVKYYTDESHKELPLYRDQELISPPAVDERVAHRQEGLSSKKCCRILVDEVKSVISAYQEQRVKQTCWKAYMRQPWAWLGLTVSLLLIVFYLLIVFGTGLKWSGRTGIIIEGLLIALATGWNIWLLCRESQYAKQEIIQRIQLIINRLDRHGLNAIQV
jgi:hypothetical protein